MLTMALGWLLLAMPAACQGASEPSIDQLTREIVDLMGSNTSTFREESYGYIEFHNCVMRYSVSGTVVGNEYTYKYDNIDFAKLDINDSREGEDYSSFIVLSFNGKFPMTGTFNREVSTVVIGAANREGSKKLFALFTKLGNLCKPPQKQPPSPPAP
ncbi:hypothetical protein L4X63_02975 [Geomonas sp. Red32]|uniref:hypothetical protein n=1 Tax=Geomonas sp. Red32 TaxID=2912856 RepID=UPI00202CC692|nr:hypothetical protein [Geomonas sp. Red32]MCM0080545.1 hypothetical protein [Geomonas sp. Red32]